MKLTFYDPGPPFKNDYLTPMYFDQLKAYCGDNNITVVDITDLMTVKNEVILLNAHWLEAGVITRLKENGNTIISFDINDNSVFTSVVPFDEINHIDLIFKIAGIQKTDTSYEVHIDDDFNFGRELVPFSNFEKYREIVDSGKVRPLPHVPWTPISAEEIPWDQRSKLVLLRGSHQYLRVLLYFQLLKSKLVDRHSMFLGSMYLHQYCEPCKQVYKNHGNIKFKDLNESLIDSPCRLKNWTKGFNNGCVGEWNNSCLPRFYDLAILFHEKYGDMDFAMIEKAFDGRWYQNWITTILNRYIFYADMKWIFSIYTPPRFWEAAGARTINLLPERLKDQIQFPAIEEGVHYVSYKEDFSDLEDKVKSMDQKQFEFITDNCFDLYNNWIKPGKYRTSENLLMYIIREIEKTCMVKN
uniref:Glycosyltransferase n=2 Tax=viral metagenome TaxID=1070528 RepID=A0A6M3IRU9_9ZZZZ